MVKIDNKYEGSVDQSSVRKKARPVKPNLGVENLRSNLFQGKSINDLILKEISDKLPEIHFLIKNVNPHFHNGIVKEYE